MTPILPSVSLLCNVCSDAIALIKLRRPLLVSRESIRLSTAPLKFRTLRYVFSTVFVTVVTALALLLTEVVKYKVRAGLLKKCVVTVKVVVMDLPDLMSAL